MTKTKSLLILIFTLLFSNYYLPSFTEEITITTYYPSPVGIYKELRAKKMAIGEDYYNPSSYSWGSEISSDADLVVEGRVGIGTENPQEELHVAGDTEIEGNLKVEGNLKLKDHTGTIDSLLSGGIIKEKFLPYCKQEITSDVYTNGENPQTGCDFGGYTGYYDISNLTPENVKKGVTFGRGQVGTYEGEVEVYMVKNKCRTKKCAGISSTPDSCTASVSCSPGDKMLKCYVRKVCGGCGSYTGCHCGGWDACHFCELEAADFAIFEYGLSGRDEFHEITPISDSECEATFNWSKDDCRLTGGKITTKFIGGEIIGICQKTK